MEEKSSHDGVSSTFSDNSTNGFSTVPLSNAVPSKNCFQISWITVLSLHMSQSLVNMFGDLMGSEEKDLILNVVT